MKEIIKKIYKEKKKSTRNQTTSEKSHQIDKYLGCPPRKILATILKVDQRRTPTNEPGNKKTHDNS